MKEVTHEISYQCGIEYIKTFILTRPDKLTKSRLPKQGKVVDAIEGKINLLKLAFDLCKSPNLLDIEMNKLKMLAVSDENNTSQSSQQICRHEIKVNSIPTNSILVSKLLDNAN